MNESRRINELNAVGPGRVIYDNEPQTEMLVDSEIGPVEEELVNDASKGARTVVIEPMHHGYVVKLDCHKFAFESADRALKYITEYLKDPQGTEQKWWNHELFK